MNDNNFWQDVMKTFGSLPVKMKIVWLLAPPMFALVMIAYIAAVAHKYSQLDADLVS